MARRRSTDTIKRDQNRDRVTEKQPSRAEQLTIAFRRAAKRATADHATAGRSVFGKVDGRLTEVVKKKNK
jgi:hypothetical protein